MRIRMGMGRAIAGLLLVLLAAGTALGIDGARAQQRPNVHAALLQPGDLPAGWTPVDLSGLGLDDLDTGDLASLDVRDLGLNPAGPCGMALAPLLATLRQQPPAIDLAIYRKAELGPFLAHVVIALPPSLAEVFVNLSNPMVANAIMDACRDELGGAASAAMELAELQAELDELGFTINTTPLKIAPIGDQSVASRTDVTVGFLGTSLLSTITRRGGAISMIFLLTDPNSATLSTGLIEQLARTADARMSEVLGR